MGCFKHISMLRTARKPGWKWNKILKNWKATKTVRRGGKPRDVSLALSVAYLLEIPVGSERSIWPVHKDKEAKGGVKGCQGSGWVLVKSQTLNWNCERSNPESEVDWKIKQPSQELKHRFKWSLTLIGLRWSEIANASGLTSFQK